MTVSAASAAWSDAWRSIGDVNDLKRDVEAERERAEELLGVSTDNHAGV